jgi:transcriptional adapter 3
MAATPTSSSIVAAAAAGSDKQAISSMPKETAYIHTQTVALVSGEQSIEALINNSSSGAKAANAADPPSAKELQSLYDSIKNTVMKTMNKRGEVCDRSMRQLAQKRKERIALEREQEAARAEEEAKRAKAERKKVGKKRSADEMEEVERTKKEDTEDVEEEKKGGMPDVGARGVARQDGVGVGEGESP